MNYLKNQPGNDNQKTVDDLRSLDFKPKKPNWNPEAELPKDWYGGNAFMTAYMNALSLTFPPGEDFFVHSVKQFKDQIDDPVLRRHIKAFIGQEATHSQHHRTFNNSLKRHGYPIEKIETIMDTYIAAEYKLPPKLKLAFTAAMEHFTAILAKVILSDETMRKEMHPEMEELFRWHAIEEIEHKAVAFDVLKTVAPGYLLRTFGMLVATADFAVMSMLAFYLLAEDGRLFRWDNITSMARFFWGQPGIFRQIFIPWLSYFKPGFHPWQSDDRFLVETVR